jgi:hypothetical protein
MWNVIKKVITVIIGATVTALKQCRKYLISVPENHDIKELPDIAQILRNETT